MLVAIHQPQYIPWLGYFHKLDQASAFVVLDTVQYKKNEFQNRNRIKTAQGPRWLSVPVSYSFGQTIAQVRVNNATGWPHKHLATLAQSYARAPFFELVQPRLSELLSRPWEFLSRLNTAVIRLMAGLLGISTPLYTASELGEDDPDPDERLIRLTRRLGGETYLAGPGGRDYMNLAKWEAAGIGVRFQEFHHPAHAQLHGPFEPRLSALDLLYNHGPASLKILRGEA